ncbi:MAG: DNA-directed RNA polymerase subunit alpha [Synergistaceae bacterium]|nr:DNA-directed RNA polymerase subunit alpha [Synergistaceae bacterium]
MLDKTRFKVYIEEKGKDYGRLFIEPLERGYGDTLGNALRRLLLSSIRGAAVTAVKINGVLHEFSTLKGIREDVIEILMNLKHIPVKAKTDKASVNSEGFKIITLDTDDLPKDFFTREENPGVITAKDMPWDNDFEFCGDGVLCTLEPDAHLLMEIYVEQGVGYLSAERERPSQPPLPVDAILADAVFSPVRRVNYMIEPARVGQSIDYERLIIEVWTNGAVTPEEAVKEAARIAQDYFGTIADTVSNAEPIVEADDDDIAVDPENKQQEEEPEKFQGEDVELPVNEDNSVHPIQELQLSIRSTNCLLRGGIETVPDLLSKSREDLLKIRNLGKISLKEIEARLDVLGYELQPSPPSENTEENNADADVNEPDITETEDGKESEPSAEPEPETEAEAEADPESKPKTKRKRTSKSTKK